MKTKLSFALLGLLCSAQTLIPSAEKEFSLMQWAVGGAVLLVLVLLLLRKRRR